MIRRRTRLLTLVALAPLAVLSGCMEGERGYFAADPFTVGSTTGDPAIDAILAKFDAATDAPTDTQVTAAYSVLTKLGITNHTATVVLDSLSSTYLQRSIAIENVHYVDVGGTTSTCAVDGAEKCVDGFDLARISDVGITPEFYAADTAKRLRRDAAAKLGPTTASTIDIAGNTADCVDLPLPGGTARYCVLDSGMLALLDDGDVRIELTMMLPTVDATMFITVGA